MNDWIVIVGDPVAGFRYVGGFDNDDEAAEWAERHETNSTWWVARVDTPAEEPVVLPDVAMARQAATVQHAPEWDDDHHDPEGFRG